MPQPPLATNLQAPPPAAPHRADVSHHKVLASISRAAVLELLRSRAQPLGVVEVAEQVGLHQNTVRSHLDLLVDAGFAIRRSDAPKGPGRPRVVYEATAAPDDERNYRLLAEVLTHYLAATTDRPGEAAVKAGQSWVGATWRQSHGDDQHRDDQRADDQRGEVGATTASPASQEPASEEAAVAAVVRMLGDSGFAPELSADGTSVNLHRCPFRELAVSAPDVVCGAHLGIIQGALAELGGLVSATRLIPFVTPGLCVTTLARHVAAPGRDAAAGSERPAPAR